jgi:aryl-alcohol dehydrogenase-like predicted oxidoreductase
MLHVVEGSSTGGNVMEMRKLGQEGLEVSCLGLGCMGMSWAYGQPDEAESIKVIHRALELGINFFDTAEVYGPYTNEELLARALAGKRERAIIATKFGFAIEGGQMIDTDSRPANVRRACDASLKRLKIDHIDLFYQHRVDFKVPIEETVGAMSELVKAGKVRFLGLSEAGPATIQRAHATHPISAVQSEYSLWERGIEEKILPTIRELGIGLVPYCPVGRGILTGRVTSLEGLPDNDYRHRDPRYQGENLQKNLSIVEKVKEIAAECKATPAQVAIAWLLSRGKDIVPIPGTKRIKYLEENAAAANVQLSPAHVAELDKLVQRTSGPRYGEELMKRVER